jgi:hypothetical protein
MGRHWWTGPVATWTVVVLATGQLAVATLLPDLPQFDGKAFGSRLVAYPLMMLAPVAVWWWLARPRGSGRPGSGEPLPWVGFTLIALPFLVDVTGNTLDLYDTVVWWDDANHFVNWALLCGGIGVLLLRSPRLRPDWVLAGLVTGFGAVLAIAWELAEYATFIRFGTELETAYTDTLGDEALGTLGAMAAAVVLVASARRRPLASRRRRGPVGSDVDRPPDDGERRRGTAEPR